jgi:hypothetical protein
MLIVTWLVAAKMDCVLVMLAGQAIIANWLSLANLIGAVLVDFA